MSEDEESNDPTPEATELDNEDVASQHLDSASAATRAAQAQAFRLQASPESNMSSDPTYEDDEDDEEEFEEGMVSDDDDDATISEDSYREVRRQIKAEKAVPERHPDAPSVSKLQKRIQEAKANGIELDENGVRKGQVRDTANGLEYLKDKQWIPACYHTDLRKRLLQLTDARGSYLRDPTKGWDELDRTSFKEDQKDWWFEDRERRPDVLFLWEDPGYYPDYDPEIWYDHGRIVLDTKNKPLKLVRQVPSLHQHCNFKLSSLTQSTVEELTLDHFWAVRVSTFRTFSVPKPSDFRALLARLGAIENLVRKISHPS
ncbi:MAG: hypothetical protein LQ339_002120 [Xanthoria mediterranea]|nr:MAG: hypothetical protein LQ339_002120 [Xanthoria mediterranea]